MGVGDVHVERAPWPRVKALAEEGRPGAERAPPEESRHRNPRLHLGAVGLAHACVWLVGGLQHPRAITPCRLPAASSWRSSVSGGGEYARWWWRPLIAFEHEAPWRGVHGLTRWVRAQWEDYPFAKFNKHLKLLAYSDDEYAKLLEVESWTRVHPPFLISVRTLPHRKCYNVVLQKSIPAQIRQLILYYY